MAARLQQESERNRVRGLVYHLALQEGRAKASGQADKLVADIELRPPGIRFFQPANRLNRRPNRRLLDKFPAPKEYDYWTIMLTAD
jgi:hypothetical protein